MVNQIKSKPTLLLPPVNHEVSFSFCLKVSWLGAKRQGLRNTPSYGGYLNHVVYMPWHTHSHVQTLTQQHTPTLWLYQDENSALTCLKCSLNHQAVTTWIIPALFSWQLAHFLPSSCSVRVVYMMQVLLCCCLTRDSMIVYISMYDIYTNNTIHKTGFENNEKNTTVSMRKVRKSVRKHKLKP